MQMCAMQDRHLWPLGVEAKTFVHIFLHWILGMALMKLESSC